MNANTHPKAHPPRPDTPGSVDVGTELHPGAVVCRVLGELEARTTPRFIAALEAALRQVRPQQELRLDLSGVGFFDSAGLEALLRVREAATARRIPVVLLVPSRPVRRVLELSDAEVLFTISTGSRPTAVSATVDPALRHARDRLDAGRWRPTAQDRAALTALLPELAWVEPAALPSLAPLARRADRLYDVIGELAMATLTVHGELSGLLSQCVTALAPLGPVADAEEAAERVPSPAGLSDAESALVRLCVFLRSVVALRGARPSRV